MGLCLYTPPHIRRAVPKKVTSITGNSQEVKGYAQLKGRAMPKLCEKGCAQKLLNKSGNSHKVKGYAQLFNSCERLLLGTLILNKIDWIRNISDEHNSLTLSTTNWGTD